MTPQPEAVAVRPTRAVAETATGFKEKTQFVRLLYSSAAAENQLATKRTFEQSRYQAFQ